MHALMDSTAPSHESFAAWYGYPSWPLLSFDFWVNAPYYVGHALGDISVDSARFEKTIGLLRAYDRAFELDNLGCFCQEGR
jgi:hypothetical protein